MENRSIEFDTKGIDIMKVLIEAREHGNAELAETIEKQIMNVQICYDVLAQKYTTTGEKLWQIDAEYLKAQLHK